MTAIATPTKPRDPKAGAPIDRILQRLIGTAIVALVTVTIIMWAKIAVIEVKAQDHMTGKDGLSLEARMTAVNPPQEWRDRVIAVENGQHEILQELAAIRAVVERLAQE